MSDPVERQVAAYNDHDLEGFLACFAEGAIVTGPDGSAVMTGLDEMRAQYGAMFARQAVHAEIVNRLTVGDWVVDHERLSRPGESLEVLVAYEVTGDHITRMITLR
jgi:hypothetical protein